MRFASHGRPAVSDDAAPCIDAPFEIASFDDVPDFGDVPGAGKRGEPIWRSNQRTKEVLAEALTAIGKPERGRAMAGCCRCIAVYRHANGRTVRGLVECRDLVCPTGMRARSGRLMASVGNAVEQFLDRHRGAQGLMVTLTDRSVSSPALAAQVGRLGRAIGELMQRRRVKRAVLAWVRSLEVTRNPVTGLWHVHVHMIWIVDRAAYFARGSRLYIDVPALRALWRKQLKSNTDLIVDMRPLRGVQSPLSQEGRKSLREVLKYCFKPGSLVERHNGRLAVVGRDELELYDAGDGRGPRLMTCVPLRALCDALRSRRLVSSSRNLQGESDLDFTDDPDADAKARAEALGAFLCIEFYEWRVFNGRPDYFLVGREFDVPAAERRWSMPP
jgi:hypothetical protein